MKQWAEDHPKAKLMNRKRADILRAAREAFLSAGYEGTSMEAIAEAADVSIMTLYRHAESKDDLFAAVIASACDMSDEGERAEFERIMRKGTGELLVDLAMIVQQRLYAADTVALMRAVMAEIARFPTLGQTAYTGFVGHLEEMMVEVFAVRPETMGLGKSMRRRLAAKFIDRLVGVEMLQVLLGVATLSVAEQKRRAQRASEQAMASIAEEIAAA